MSDSVLSSSAHLQELLDLFRAGHAPACDALLQHSLERVRQLAHQMFHQHANLHRLDETDDVLQKAMIRLRQALSKLKPAHVRAFYGLAARQIRWVLRDLAREMARARAVVRTGRGLPACPLGEGEPIDRADEPGDLLAWSEFHESIERLPDEARQMFDLLYYEALPQAEVAALLQVSLRTVKRRWQRARLLLHQALQGERPGG
jgi:RNA polymerase sigma-70 factor (ECF subfamily)